MPLYWGDYARDTGHLDALGHGAYLMLIKHYWCTGKPLIDNDDMLWRIACCSSPKEWLSIRARIVSLFFVGDDHRLHHKRIDAELAHANARYNQRVHAGKLGVKARQRRGLRIIKPDG
jgi:uncharacterized protein YdaU (DUF1376 family)